MLLILQGTAGKWLATVDAFRTFLAKNAVDGQTFEPGKLPDLNTPNRFRRRLSQMPTQSEHVSNSIAPPRRPARPPRSTKGSER